MNEVRIIKRYANRKLYDTQHSRYVTLDQISEMIRNGDDVKIIDNKSKEDLTSVTLAQIIFEEEKKQRSFLPLQAMRNIIQNGGESFAQLVTEAQRRVTEAQRRVTSILPRRKDEEARKDEAGEDSTVHDGTSPPVSGAAFQAGDGEAETAPAPGHDNADGGGMVKRSRDGLLEFREWIQQSQRTIEEWQKRVDDRIRNVVGGISPFSGMHKELRLLASRIGELEAKLSELAENEQTGHTAESGSGNSGATESAASESALSESAVSASETAETELGAMEAASVESGVMEPAVIDSGSVDSAPVELTSSSPSESSAT